MKVGVRSYFSVGRPPVKFHRVQSPFDAPTDNYSGSIAGLSSDVFGLRKQSPGLPLFSSLISRPSAQPPSPSSFPSLLPELPDAIARSETLSAQCIEPLTRAPESCPGPDSDSRYRCVRIIPKHLQNIFVLLFGLSNLFIYDRPIVIGRTGLVPT